MLNIFAQIVRRVASDTAWPEILIVIGALVPNCAQALPLCEGLKAITAATPNQYVNLRGDFDSAMNAYHGVLTLDSLLDCHTSSEKYSQRYACRKKMPDNAELAHRSFEALVTEVKNCFGNEIRPINSTMPDHRASFRNINGGESISISYLRHVPKFEALEPRYVLKIEVSMLQLNRKE